MSPSNVISGVVLLDGETGVKVDDFEIQFELDEMRQVTGDDYRVLSYTNKVHLASVSGEVTVVTYALVWRPAGEDGPFFFINPRSRWTQPCERQPESAAVIQAYLCGALAAINRYKGLQENKA